MTLRIPGLLAVALAIPACSAPSINLSTRDPIKVDIAMRLDVYQHGGGPAGSAQPEPTAKPGAPTGANAPSRAKDRQAEVQVFKNSRLVGEGRDGLLVILGEPAGDYGDHIRRTVTAENRDRMAAMKARADQEKRPLPEIQQEQAALWLNRSFKGEWVEVRTTNGTYQWQQKQG